jgi:hypothetical protein
MPSDQTLSDLTASLLQELARSAAAADRSQRDEWVALAAEVSVPLDDYCERAAGPQQVERFMARFTGSRRLRRIPAARLAAIFGERFEGRGSVPREEVQAAVIEMLQSEAASRHRDISATLRARLPKVEMSRGTVDAKVLLRSSRNGTVTARLATPDAIPKAHELVSTIRVEFNVGAFPALE